MVTLEIVVVTMVLIVVVVTANGYSGCENSGDSNIY